MEVKHVRKNTLLVEQRNIVGTIVGDQKVRDSIPARIDLLDPVRCDVQEYLLATGIPSGLLFPRRDGEPWRLHDCNNWGQRAWKRGREAAGVDPLPRRTTCATRSPACRSEPASSIPALAEQMGHSPQMTVMTYTHVIRELKGEPRISAEKQIERARRKARGPQVNPKAGARSA